MLVVVAEPLQPIRFLFTPAGTIMYSIKEMFYSLQGEGAHAGRPAIFCRFTGCNLWSGREADRETAQCRFCDTDFIGTQGHMGGKYPDASAVVEAIGSLWPAGSDQSPYVVCTGGEPLLQLDDVLIDAMHQAGFIIALETNGTLALPKAVDWVCVSPKGNSDLVLTQGNELKLVYPQAELQPEQFTGLAFRYFFIQPCDTSNLTAAQRNDLLAAETSEQAAVNYCLTHPQWRLSLQTHKLLGIE